MAKGLKTDGPEFCRTLCAVLVELDSMRDQSISEERGLVNARKKLEKDLGKLGEDDGPESDRVRVAYTKVIMALKSCRAQIEHLNDQICRGLKFGQQPMLIQSEQEDRIRELVSGKDQAEHALELWKSTAAESARVGSQSGEGQAGPVGEPDGDDDDDDGASDDMEEPAPIGIHPAPDGKGGQMIANMTRVLVHDAAGKLVADGKFYGYRPSDEEYSVLVDGKPKYFSFQGHTVDPFKDPAPAAVPLDSKVQVLHIATTEVKGEGTLESETEELWFVRIGAKRKEFAKDIYRLEPVVAAVPATTVLGRGAAVRVLIKETGELEASGVVHTLHADYALVTVGGRQRRFAFDAYAIEPDQASGGVASMVRGEIHESKPTKGAKKSKAAKA